MSSKYKNNDSRKDDNRGQHNCHNCSRGPQQKDTISIVSGSASKTTDDYQPNPARVSVVSATAASTNDDSQSHIVPSGENAIPDGGFDSGIMTPAPTFERTLSHMQRSTSTFAYYIQTWLDQSAQV